MSNPSNPFAGLNTVEILAKIKCCVPGCHRFLPRAYCPDFHVLCGNHQAIEECPICTGGVSWLSPLELGLVGDCIQYLQDAGVMDTQGELIQETADEICSQLSSDPSRWFYWGNRIVTLQWCLKGEPNCDLVVGIFTPGIFIRMGDFLVRHLNIIFRSFTSFNPMLLINCVSIQQQYYLNFSPLIFSLLRWNFSSWNSEIGNSSSRFSDCSR